MHLESTLCETQSQSLTATNSSDLLNLKLEKLKKYSRRLCLIIPGVKLPQNKANEKAWETETKVQEPFSRELGVSKDGFEYELHRIQRLPINSTESTRCDSPLNIIRKFRTHRFRKQLHAQKKYIDQLIAKNSFMSA